MTTPNLRLIEQDVVARGPDRIMINKAGHSVPPHTLDNYFLRYPDVIFIRQDGWSLGTHADLEDDAYRLFKGEWLGVLRRGEVFAMRIESYEST